MIERIQIMKIVKAAVFALGLFLIPGTLLAAEFTKGTIQKVDVKAKKLTIKHEELKSLEMPPMTMVFRVADEAMLTSVKEGQKVEFVAERLNGKLTVTEIK
jgi:Cu/Ag efflux protein CusF